jgi:hypothetical protein
LILLETNQSYSERDLTETRLMIAMNLCKAVYRQKEFFRAPPMERHTMGCYNLSEGYQVDTDLHICGVAFTARGRRHAKWMTIVTHTSWKMGIRKWEGSRYWYTIVAQTCSQMRYFSTLLLNHAHVRHEANQATVVVVEGCRMMISERD